MIRKWIPTGGVKESPLFSQKPSFAGVYLKTLLKLSPLAIIIA